MKPLFRGFLSNNTPTLKKSEIFLDLAITIHIIGWLSSGEHQRELRQILPGLVYVKNSDVVEISVI